jgi:lauroyl/myristoyl acyltransferase
MKNLIKIILACCLFPFFTSCLTQKEKEENRKLIVKIVMSNNFKFVAQQANPLRMMPRQLTSEYSLIVSPDSINCYLPYFGVATQVPYGSTDMGIQFITTKFSYDKKTKSDGSYEIVIIPIETDKVTKLYLQISENGFASLNVTSNYRDPITFIGSIEKR